MTKIKQKKNQKPIEIDAHFKYKCPKCSCDHWISLNEAKTKNFKIVCHCSKVFKPKRIVKLKIQYADDPVKVKNTIDNQTVVQNQSDTNLDKELSTPEQVEQITLNKCTSILVDYGFTESESIELVNKAYSILQSNDCGQLIKHALKSFGGSNE